MPRIAFLQCGSINCDYRSYIMRLLQSLNIDIEPAAHRYIIKMPRYSPGEATAHRTAEKSKRRMA